MTTKKFAFEVHEHLKAHGMHTVTRSQTHELLAAAAGYSTKASFQVDAVWSDVPWRKAERTPDDALVLERFAELGLPTSDASEATQCLLGYLAGSDYTPVRFEELIATFAGEEEDPAFREWVAGTIAAHAHQGLDALLERYPALLEGLEHAAAKGHAAAHLAIACLLETFCGVSEEEDLRFGREIGRSGQWTSPYVSFAELRLQHTGFADVAKQRHHLLAAARAGDQRALMETAERFGDPAALDLESSACVDAVNLAWLARDSDRPDMVHKWLTVSALEGDVSSMRELIEEGYDTDYQAWVWMHLSRLLGEDLARDRHVAVNEDGTPYDDDIGGPAYVGGDDGIQLVTLDIEEDRRALTDAVAMFDRIKVQD